MLKNLVWAIVLALGEICLVSSLPAQSTGGHAPGQAIPQEAKKADLGSGPVGDNVDLFTGNLSLSYDFGSVATLSGLSFPIRLQYSSSSLFSFDPAHTSGVPYGEGWALSEASVTVETHAFDFLPGELPRDPQLRPMYTPLEVAQQGQLYYSNIKLQLPGGRGGRLVYKYPDQDDATVAVYHLNAFESYLEVRFDGQKWEARTDDGAVYVFSLPQYRLRNPTNTTAHLATHEVETSVPLAEVTKWHLTEIYHPNHANNQKILFEYDQFGKQENMAELEQPMVKQTLDNYAPQRFPFVITQTHYDSLLVAAPDPFVVMAGDTISPGDTIWVEAVSPLPVSAYRDVFLRSVTATDGQGQDISRVELKYKSWRPEQELASDPLRLNRGQFLVLSDPRVIRRDSLYSQKTVWFRGQDHSVSQTAHGTRPPESSVPFSTAWKRYQHPAAHQNPLSRKNPVLDPANPFVAIYSGIAGIVPNAQYWAWRRALDQSGLSIPFTHSVLESARINRLELPGGDWYELRSLIKLDPALVNQDANFDLRVTTGVTDNHPLVNNVEVNYPFAGQDFKLRPAALQSGHWTNPSGYMDNGYELYSTTRNIVKWNPAYQRGNLFLATRNRFRLGNLPNEFAGFTLQIGPGADNLDHAAAHPNDDSYRHYFTNLDNVNSPRDYHPLRYGSWFGTGAPLEPMFRTDRFGLVTSANHQKGPSGDRFLWWMLNVQDNAYSPFVLSQQGPNQPTALTREQLKTGLSTSHFFDRAPFIAAAHEVADDARLWNVELVRIAKNPWLLDSVIFYVGNGDYGVDRIPTAAYKLEYDLQQVPVPNNLDRSAGNPFLNYAADYKIVNGDTAFRNLFQLTGIYRLDCDSTGQISPPASPAVTQIAYLPDDRSTPLFNEGYLVATYWTELGGKQWFEYDLGGGDTVAVNQSRVLLSADQSYQVMGQGGVYQQRVPIRRKYTETDGQSRFVEYEFQNPVFFHRGYRIDPHFDNGMTHSLRGNKVWGYGKATVHRPYIGGTQRVRSEYTFATATATHADSLLFGRLIKVEEYDSENRLTTRNQTSYAAHLVYQNGQHYQRPPLGSDNGHQIETRANFLKEYEPAYLFGQANDRWMDSYFVRVQHSQQTVRDVNSGNAITSTTEHTYYDWDDQRADTDGDYDEMWRSIALSPWFTRTPWYHASSGQFSYASEPSWQLASTRSSSSDHPGAFQEKRFFYLWDIAPFLAFNDPLTQRFAGSHRPFYLARKYGIRSVAYEQQVRRHNGHPDEPPHQLSTYFQYDIFQNVPGDFVWQADSSNYGRLCDPGDGGGPMQTNRQAATYCFGEGEPVQIEAEVAELLADPRYVKSPSGQWYFFPIESYTALDLAQIAAPQPACPGGVVIGLESEAHYFGTLDMAGGGTIAAASIAAPGKKTLLLGFCPHKHDHTTCEVVHGFASDSTMTRMVQDSSSTPNGERQNFIDMLQQQFFLRAVHQQADTLPNQYLHPDSLHHPDHPSPHNLWELELTGDVYHSTPYRFTWRPPFPTIRTYRVHARNLHGQVIDESDARHRHTLYQYEKGIFRSWFTRCGEHRTALTRYNFGVPRTVTVTDFGTLEHVSHFDFYPDKSLKSMWAPDSSWVAYAYDGKKRLVQESLNGTLRRSYAYHQWDGDRTASWDARIAMNYVETSSVPEPGDPPVTTRAYVDPLGRSAQTVTGAQYLNGNWRKAFAGVQKFDAWDRVTTRHRPYGKDQQTDLDYDPIYTPGPARVTQYERAAGGRPLATAQPGNAIGGKEVNSSYEIISVVKFQTETGASNTEIAKLFPTLGAVFGGGGGNGGGNSPSGKGKVTATGPLPGQVHLFKTSTTDEDGRRVIAYANASGWKIATLGFTDSAYSDKVLTLFVHDGAGRVACTIHPNKLVSATQYNLFGWPYLTRTPDRGTTKLFYNQAGDLRYSQNEKRKAEGKFTAISYDRMGRAYREEILALSPLQIGNLEYLPLHYRDTLGVPFSNIQTFADELWRLSGDENADNGLWNADFSGLSFPVLHFYESHQRILAERRYDYPLDSAVNDPMVPHPCQGMQHPNVPQHQRHTKGRLVAESVYDTQGRPVELSVMSYTDEGQTDWLVRQFRSDGITPLQRGKAHRINYYRYDIAGKLREKGIDLGADGTRELGFSYRYNDDTDPGFGALREVYVNEGQGPRLLTHYDYEPATGQLERQINFTWNDSCTAAVPVDTLAYRYDVQDRMNGMDSRMLDFALFYDGDDVNAGLSGGERVDHQQNFNGNINGWRFDYKVAGYGVSGFNGATVYGFEYDGLNRLTQADASVLENNLITRPAGAPVTTYGVALGSSDPSWYGDAIYEYDAVGNITGLRRYRYFEPGAPVSGSRGENWQYFYQTGSNRLAQLVTGGQIQAGFNYDDLGNLVRDTRAGITVAELDHRNLPVSLVRAGDTTAYLYGRENLRIWKSSGTGDFSYYLREASGTTAAIWSERDSTWTFELHGNDLIGEYVLGADSSDSTARRAAPGRTTGRARQWLRKGRNMVLGALATSLAAVSPRREGRTATPPAFLEMLVPALLAVGDVVEDWVSPGPLAPTSNERRAAEVSGPDLKFFVKDHLGNVRVAYRPLYRVDSVSGLCELSYVVGSVLDFYPYGKALRSFYLGDPERVQTTEHERDAESGWDYRGARFYSAEYGRFLSVDPLAGIFFGWSPYNYVLGNPISLTDPDGRMPGDPKWAQKAEDGVPITYIEGLTITSGTASPAWAQQSSEEFASGRTLGPVYAGRNNSGIGTIQLTAEGAEIFLDILGSSEIPILATFADLGAAALALGRGDEVGAGLSLLAAIP
ncbi:MAG: RHS repeat-associated core domain-containing protein, partial [Bacteroidota bacterium]